ncbi:hypothetical protein J437_LFUL009237 [Ladona fulva]|uniref:RanBP2-type domain-containing protein n=1 Tax=Ladona fulva TaxID=123851 RepID=A0A8K0KNC8_LADFU|nr:hypothetical protein J437_LFUL009237 [Ladona fulva]
MGREMKRGFVGREGERFQESEFEEEDRERDDDNDREKRRKIEAEEGDGRFTSQQILGLKMDQKKSPNRRTKRHAKVLEENFWDCSVCTYRNTAEAFKCLMCDVRKGTSTRKPRINPQLVAQQVAQQYTPTPLKANKKEGSKEKLEKKGSSSDGKSSKKSRHP